MLAAKGEGAKIELYYSLEVPKKAVESRLSKFTAKKLEADRAQFQKAADEQSTWRKIRTFVETNLKLEVDPSVRAIKDIREIRVKNIEMPFPPDRVEGETVDVSFEVEIDLLVSVLRSVPKREAEPPPKPRLGVGETNPLPPSAGDVWGRWANFSWSDSEKIEVDEIQTVVCRILARAKYTGGAYSDITILGLEAPDREPTMSFDISEVTKGLKGWIPAGASLSLDLPPIPKGWKK